jgi:hypothetical protein
MSDFFPIFRTNTKGGMSEKCTYNSWEHLTWFIFEFPFIGISNEETVFKAKTF